MHVENVEIFSDQTNAAIMRHPGRAFPGVLIQGDTLYGLCKQADAACKKAGRRSPEFSELNELRNSLWAFLVHYKSTLVEHDMQLPFNEVPSGS
jgi:Family of unknown function (DUF6959)